MPVCALCKREAELQRSHVISKFAQKRTKSEDGTLLLFGEGNNPDGDRVQDAFFEELLCRECEARLQRWEEHAARMMNQRKVFDFDPNASGQLRRLDGFDYPKMKLFVLSILWRMGASNLPNFSHIDLGPHLERIGQMLLAGDAGEPVDYGCGVRVVCLDGQRVTLTRTADCVRYRDQNIRIYRALIDGLLFIWIVGSSEHMKAFQPRQGFLQSDGSWLVRSSNLKDVSFLKRELDSLAQGFTEAI